MHSVTVRLMNRMGKIRYLNDSEITAGTIRAGYTVRETAIPFVHGRQCLVYQERCAKLKI